MRTLMLAMLAATLLPAQARFPRHHFTVGGGGGIPDADLKPFLDTSPVVRVNYGYRFTRNFQADFGLDTVFHAANVRDFLQSQVGDLRIKDYQFLLPFGGRVVVPWKRLEVFGGGGPTYFRYQERVRQPFGGGNFQIDCPVCRSRSGWGYYATVGFSVALDRGQHFRLGASSRVYRGDTSGDAFGPLPALQTRDHWINSAAELTLSF